MCSYCYFFIARHLPASNISFLIHMSKNSQCSTGQFSILKYHINLNSFKMNSFQIYLGLIPCNSQWANLYNIHLLSISTNFSETELIKILPGEFNFQGSPKKKNLSLGRSLFWNKNLHASPENLHLIESK